MEGGERGRFKVLYCATIYVPQERLIYQTIFLFPDILYMFDFVFAHNTSCTALQFQYITLAVLLYSFSTLH